MIDEIFDVSGLPFASIRLRIGPPEPDPSGDSTFGCRVEVKAGSETIGPYTFFGEGELQALLLSLSLAAELIAKQLGSDGRIESPVWDRLQRLRPTDAELAAARRKLGREE